MLKVETFGLDGFQKDLEKLEEGIREIDGKHSVPMPEVLTDSFVSEHTKFSSLNELLETSGFDAESAEDFEAIPDEPWDDYISSVSCFNSWQDMLESACAKWATSKLHLD
jgi:hypothetical protein